MKIEGVSDCAWATILKDQQDVFKAGLLVESLRRVLSSHKVIAVCSWDEIGDNIRSELSSKGFAFTVSASNPKSFDSILQNSETKKVLNGFRRIILLPVDSIVLRNCDDLMSSSALQTAENHDSEAILIKDLNECMVISRHDQHEWKQNLTISSPIIHTIYGSMQTGSLENIPPIVRLPDLTSDNVPNVMASISGLLEKEIISYWDKLCTIPTQESNDSSDSICNWLSEPVAVIGTVDSSSSIPEALKATIKESGMPCGVMNPSRCAVFTISTDELGISEFTSSIQNSSKHFSQIHCTAFTSLVSALTQALDILLRDFSSSSPNRSVLIFYKDGKDKISTVTLKRASQAISNGDKIQALLGFCTDSKLINLPNDPSSADIKITDIIEVVKFLKHRVTHVNSPWLNWIKIEASHERESAVFRHSAWPEQLVVSVGCLKNVEENYPQWTLGKSLKRPLHCIALQHEDSSGLLQIAGNLNTYLSSGFVATSVSFPDVAYTLNTKLSRSCESQHSGSRTRAMIIAQDVNEAVKQLNTKSFLTEELKENNRQQKLCFMFTGQGSQYPGMGKVLYETCPAFRLSLDRCNSLFREMFKIDIHSVIYKDSSELSRTVYSQTAIFCVDYALLQAWKSWGIEPDYVVGHSLGEFCAAVAAGALEMEDAMRLVGERSRLIDELPRGKMLVLRGNQKTVQDLLHEFTRSNPGSWLDFAAINSKDQTVLSGDSKWIEMFAQFTGTRKVRSLVLEATHAFHSRHMDPMLEKYRKVVENCKGDMMPKKCVYVSGREGKVVNGPLNADYWVGHCREPVRFVLACRTLWEEGCRVFVECGPQPILTAMAKINMSALESGSSGQLQGVAPVFYPSIRRGIDDWKTILNTLTKLWLQGTRDVDWKGFEKYYGRRLIANDLMVVTEKTNDIAAVIIV